MKKAVGDQLSLYQTCKSESPEKIVLLYRFSRVKRYIICDGSGRFGVNDALAVAKGPVKTYIAALAVIMIIKCSVFYINGSFFIFGKKMRKSAAVIVMAVGNNGCVIEIDKTV